MNRSEALAALAGARVGHLATTKPDGTPHVVPITFAVDHGTIVTMIDHKPKSTTRLQRLINIEANPRVSVLADAYSEDWSRLWWVRVDGTAGIHDAGGLWARAREALAAKYDQYGERPPQGAAITMPIDELTWWSSTP